jgi:hypothetical protein
MGIVLFHDCVQSRGKFLITVNLATLIPGLNRLWDINVTHIREYLLMGVASISSLVSNQFSGVGGKIICLHN